MSPAMAAPHPPPLVPAEVDLSDFPFMPMDTARLRDSDLAALASAEGFRAAVLAWCVAWHQVPSGSLPDDDRLIARLIGFGRDVGGWQAIREEALHGFVLCSDGRLYHPVICQKALEAWERKASFRARAKAGASKRWGSRDASGMPEASSKDGEGNACSVSKAQHEHSNRHASRMLKNAKGQGQGQGQGQKSLSRDGILSVREGRDGANSGEAYDEYPFDEFTGVVLE